MRSITTRCLSGANADYNTLDTGTAYVPDFARYAAGLRWKDFQKDNPDVADDDPSADPYDIRMMEVLRKFGYISSKEERHQRYGIPIWYARQGENKTMKTQSFLMNDQLWNELILSSSIGHR